MPGGLRFQGDSHSFHTGLYINKFIITGWGLIVGIMYVFIAELNKNTVVTNLFPDPVVADAIRIRPTAWRNVIQLRMELLGCLVSDQNVN